MSVQEHRRGNSDTHNGHWPAVAAGVLIQLCLGVLFAWSAFASPLTKPPYNFTRFETQLIFSCGLAMFALSMAFAAERVKTRLGSRLAMLIVLFGLLTTAADAASCQLIGNQTYCDNGFSGQRIGNTTYWNDGTSSQQVGNSILNSDGSSAQRRGNQTYYSDGSSSRTVGDFTYFSDGTSCQRVGNQVYCN